VQLNLTDQGFPPELKGLAAWKRAFDKKASYQMAFATRVVLDSSGRWPLCSSGSGYLMEASRSTNYDPDRYLVFLDKGLDRNHRLQVLEARRR
jgi:hypothetical protein